MSAEEESQVVHNIAGLIKSGKDCQRISLDLGKSILKQLQDVISNNPGYKIVPINELFENMKFIEIS